MTMGAKSPSSRSMKRGMLRGSFTQYDHGEPIKAIDTRPMAFVFGLVALVMIAAEPVPTNTLDYVVDRVPPGTPFHQFIPTKPWQDNDTIINEVSVTADERILWNCEQITSYHLNLLLMRMEQASPKPLLKFEPDPNVSYDFAMRIVQSIQAANVTWFKLDGLEDHASFDSALRSSSSPPSFVTSLSIDFDSIKPISPHDQAQIAKASAAQCPSKGASK